MIIIFYNNYYLCFIIIDIKWLIPGLMCTFQNSRKEINTEKCKANIRQNSQITKKCLKEEIVSWEKA